MTILIVDDDADIRHLLAIFLTFKGYHTLSAANGQEALIQLQFLDAPPLLILLDQMMPVMDGAAFRQVQQQDPQLATIPVVLLSAVDTLEARPLPADAFLPKPINLDSLLALVAQFYCQRQLVAV
jgi:CheY-like chemotaxis protein